jgi:hypothetical protein
LFVFLGQSNTTYIAAACNLCTAFLIFNASKYLRAAPHQEQNNLPSQKQKIAGLPYPFVFFSLILIGYISLSQEIIWYRLIGFAAAGRPQIFGIMLTAFLIGIALGSLRSKKICENFQDPYSWIVRALILASIVFYIATPAVAFISTLIGQTSGPIFAYFLTGVVAYYTGGMLPMLIHIGVSDDQKYSSMSMSWLYFANIIGASCGPMVTGFILLDKFTLEENIILLTGLTLLFLVCFLVFIPKTKIYKLRVFVGILAAIAVATPLHHFLFNEHLERIQFAQTRNHTV